MNSGRLLVMVLNLMGPIPNAAAINSHLPDSVLLIRLKSGSASGENKLDESLGRLRAWANGTLPKLYGFDHDINLKHPPDELQTSPQIEVLEVEGISSSSKEICDEIKSICDSLGHHEVRIDVAAGRKEDAAGLARLPEVVDQEGECTVWYTDATSGTSVEIGGELVENGEPPLSQMTKFWLNGSPILGSKQELVCKELRGGLLTSVLDSIEEISKSTKKVASPEKQVERLIRDLDGLDIGVSEENWGYKFYRRDLEDKWVGIPKLVFNGKVGYWVENVAALAVVDAWDCERVYVGVSVGHRAHQDRMGCLFAILRNPWGGMQLSRVWSDCRAEGMLPDAFSGLDFLDSESVYTRLDGEEATGFNRFEYYPPKKYKEEYPDLFPGKWEENKKMIKRFAQWATFRNWRALPSDLHDYLTPFCQNRDLDVFADTASHCLFVECKIGPETGGLSAGYNKAQIDSLMASSASRGVNYSILTHTKHDIDTWRSGVFDFIVPWSKLRRPEEMLESVINRGSPKRKWWEKSVHPHHLHPTSTVTTPTNPPQEEKGDQGVTHGPTSKRRRASRKAAARKGWGGWTPTRQDPPPPTDEVPEGKFYCPECMDPFNSARWLNEHRQETGHSSYKCEECSAILITDVRVVWHSEETGHKKFSGTNFHSERLWVPWGEDLEAQKTLLESGFYDKAIENRWDSGKFCRMLVQETGKEVWREIYGVVPKSTKANVYFNSVRPGLVLFIQGDDGRWYASDPGRGDEEE